MALIDVDGAWFGYDEAGTGPAVVLVHGALGDRRMWDHQFRALAQSHCVIRYDWRGYGESADPDGEVAHFEDVIAVMDALDIPDAVLVGCSYGGAHCLEATLHAPERVRALVLVCAGLTDHEWSEEMRRDLRDRFADVDRADPAAMAAANLDYMVVGPGRARTELDPQVWEQSMAMCTEMFARSARTPDHGTRYLDPPASGRLGDVKVPTLVVNGLADAPDLQAIADRLARGIAGARRLDLPDTGHMPSLERPAELTSALVDFLAGL